MRVSSVPGDPGYRPDHGEFSPLLDGEGFGPCVVTLDEEAGEATLADGTVRRFEPGRLALADLRWRPGEMRMSARRDDPGHRLYLHHGPKIEVLFDGEQLDGCVTADEAECAVWCHVPDGRGGWVVAGDEFAVVRRRGRVEIRRRP